MAKDLFKDRERASEEEYARKRDAELIQKMREKAALEEVASALGKALQVENPELVRRVIELGIQPGTGAALLLAPLVQVAWAEGKVTDKEREVVFRLAASRGVEKESTSGAQLAAWLDRRPSDAVFATALDVIKAGIAHLTPQERAGRIDEYAKACREVSEASGGLSKAFGGSGVSSEERSVLDQVTAALRSD